MEQEWYNLRFDFPSVQVESWHFGSSSLSHDVRYDTKKLSENFVGGRGAK